MVSKCFIQRHFNRASCRLHTYITISMLLHSEMENLNSIVVYNITCSIGYQLLYVLRAISICSVFDSNIQARVGSGFCITFQTKQYIWKIIGIKVISYSMPHILHTHTDEVHCIKCFQLTWVQNVANYPCKLVITFLLKQIPIRSGLNYRNYKYW